jgi:hypothetical protein
MSRYPLDRRRFLTLSLAALLVPAPGARAAEAVRRGAYGVDVGLLWEVLSLRLPGTIEESMDRERGRYQVRAVGRGSRIANRVESSGILRDGRWAPLQGTSWFEVAGRQTETRITYDYARAVVEYHHRGETFFLRRLRVADDTVTIPEGLHVDDAVSAILNYAESRWPPRPDGTFLTHVVRRRRPEQEGPDDVQPSYRAELMPLVVTVTADPETGRPVALLDLTGFSSWARRGRPARIVFGPDRRPETIEASLILGTSVSIRLQAVA